MRDVYCVNGAGRPLNSTSCIRLIGGQCIEMLALCICIHQVLATVGLPQKLLLTRTSTFYLHVCLAALNMLICITIGVVAYHRHSMASTVFTGMITSAIWFFYTAALCLRQVRCNNMSVALLIVAISLCVSSFTSPHVIDENHTFDMIPPLTNMRTVFTFILTIFTLSLHATTSSQPISATSNPMEYATWISRVFYNWVSPIIHRGKKQRLEIEDVPPLVHDDQTTIASEQFQNALSCEQEQSSQSFLRMLKKLYGRDIVVFALWSSVNKGIGLASPLFIKLFLDWAASRTPSLQTGYALAICMIFRSILASISGTQYDLAWKRFDLRVRAGVTTAIYDRTLRLNLSRLNRIGLGHITNLLSVDLGRLVGMPGTLFDMVLIPLEIVFALWLLAHEVSYTFIGGVCVLATMLPIQTLLGSRIQHVTKKMLMYRDQRVNLTTECLRAIHTIKLLAWLGLYMKKLAHFRSLEMRQLRIRKYLDALCVVFWASTPVIVQTSVFVLVMLSGHSFTAANAFTTIALLDRLIYPMNYFPWIINGFLEARISALRIRSFLFETEELSSPQVCTVSNTVRIQGIIDFKWPNKIANDLKGEEVDESQMPLLAPTEIDESITDGFLLRIENLELEPNVTYVVSGSVGAGKTSLLLALLGEMPMVSSASGSITRLQSRVSYAPQVPWLFRGTVRENITMCSDASQIDVGRYERVLDVCDLQHDLRSHPGGDRTMVSEQGTNFSGGQRLRISLARALYQQSQLYLLDDPLSGLDNLTTRRVLDKCFACKSHGSIFPKGAIVVLVTHAVQLMTEFESTCLLVMQNGQIINKGKDFSSSVTTKGLDTDQDTEVVTSASLNECGYHHEREMSKLCEENVEEHGEDSQEHRESGSLHFAVWTRYARAIGWPLALMIIISVIIMQLTRNGLDWWIAYYTNRSTSATPISSHMFTRILLSITGVNIVAVVLRSFLFACGGLIAAQSVYCALVNAVFYAPLSFYRATPIGQILNRLSGDTYGVDETLPFILNIFLKDFADVIGALVIIFYGNKFVLVLLVPLILVYSWLQHMYRPTSRHIRRLDATTQSPLLGLLTETFEGLCVVRAMHLESRCKKMYGRFLDTNQRVSFLGANAGVWFGLRLDMLGVMVTSFVVMYAVIEFQITKTIHAGVVGLTLTYALPIVGKLNTTLGSFVDTERQMIAVERIHEYTHEETEEGDVSDERLISSSWPSRGEIHVHNLTVTYSSTFKKSSYMLQALKNVNCIIGGGEKVGICGRTGAGKSTFMHALFRAVKWNPGSLITIDGVPIDRVPLDLLRARLTYVPQDVVLFTGTVRSNIDPEGVATDYDLWRCLTRAGLYTIVTSLPLGLESSIEPGEATLSKGQAQLLCIARALLRASSSCILCVDEATSSMDYETDAMITKALREDFAHATVLLIAHRFTTILDCDRVMLLEDGHIVEIGPPKQLMEDMSSHFHELAVNHTAK